ncbi:MAG: methyltransferase domain-containing protein [Acidobacteria bacterium]|nr:methyltransferase domain-containing protein [Acidobacteriota bacterium]
MEEAQSHRWNASDYARHSQGQETWARELMTLLRLQPHESVLDLGCGDGRMTAEIARRAPQGQVVGVDLSQDMVRHARETHVLPNLRFLQANAAALPFEDEFDVVYSNAVLHWLRDHRPALAGISRSLRGGGRCVLQMGGEGNGVDVVRAFEIRTSSPKWCGVAKAPADPYGFWGVAPYRAWLQEAGLVADAVELIEKDMLHAGRAAFTGWLRTAWHPYVSAVPEPRQEEFLEEVTNEYLRTHPPDAAGVIHVRMVRLQVLAHK